MRLIFETTDPEEVTKVLELCNSLNITSVQIVSGSYEHDAPNRSDNQHRSDNEELYDLWEKKYSESN